MTNRFVIRILYQHQHQHAVVTVYRRMLADVLEMALIDCTSIECWQLVKFDTNINLDRETIQTRLQRNTRSTRIHQYQFVTRIFTCKPEEDMV
jgi:hypothetical protein